MLQQVHLEASLAVHAVMLEHLKPCDNGYPRNRAGTPLEGLQPWVRPRWSRYTSEGIVAHREGHDGTGAPQSDCGCG